MEKTKKIDFAKLVGFAGVSDHLSDGIDFRDETIGARLGAKVGTEPVQGIQEPRVWEATRLRDSQRSDRR